MKEFLKDSLNTSFKRTLFFFVLASGIFALYTQWEFHGYKIGAVWANFTGSIIVPLYGLTYYISDKILCWKDVKIEPYLWPFLATLFIPILFYPFSYVPVFIVMLIEK